MIEKINIGKAVVTYSTAFKYIIKDGTNEQYMTAYDVKPKSYHESDMGIPPDMVDIVVKSIEYYKGMEVTTT